MKYPLAEAESYSELLQYRENLEVSFQKKERSLYEKKEKLFRSREITKWGCDPLKMDELKRR